MADNVAFDQNGNLFIFRKKEGVFKKRLVELTIDRSSGEMNANISSHASRIVRPYRSQKLQDLLAVAKVFAEMVSGMHMPSMGLGAKDSAADSARPLVNVLREATKELSETFLTMADDLDAIDQHKIAKDIRAAEGELRRLKI